MQGDHNRKVFLGLKTIHVVPLLSFSSSHGLEDLFSDRLRQMYQGIQQYVADQIRRAQEQSQHTKDQQVRDQHIQGERLRADSQGACEALLNSQAQVQNLQHMMVSVHGLTDVRWTQSRMVLGLIPNVISLPVVCQDVP